MNRKIQILHPGLLVSSLLAAGLLFGMMNVAKASGQSGELLYAKRPDFGKLYQRPSAEEQGKKAISVYPTFRRNLSVGRGTHGNLAVRLGEKAERSEFAAMEGRPAGKRERVEHNPSEGNRPVFLK